MTTCDIEDLISLLQKGQVSKEQLIENINKIQFQPPSAQPSPHKETIEGSQENPISSLEKDLDRNLRETNSYFALKNCERKDLEVPDEKCKEKRPVRDRWVRTGSFDKAAGNVQKSRGGNSTINFSRADYEAAFFERMEMGEFSKMAKQTVSTIEKEQEEMRECSFKPKINPSAKLLSEETRKRFHNLHRSKFIISQVRKESNYYDADNKDHTFSPVIHSKNAKSRYTSSINTPVLSNNTSICVIRCDSPELTFHPKINSSSKLLQRGRECLLAEAKTRPLQSPEKLPSSKSSKKLPTDTQRTQVNIDKLNSFLERQAKFEFMKKCKNQKLLNQAEITSIPNSKRGSVESHRNKYEGNGPILNKLDLLCKKRYKNASMPKKEGSFGSELAFIKPARAEELSPIERQVKPCNARRAIQKSTTSTFTQFKLRNSAHKKPPTDSKKTQSIINKLYKQMEDCRKVIDLAPGIKRDNSFAGMSKPLQSVAGNFTVGVCGAACETNVSKV
eukprot:TRINITY_DN3060_c0_g1_i8.p1 TRINITY_DN3060_c0_g1~~TRINITY_DN3060_c0_g1_i8.p1  ORF type:complete len:504 (+),score=110.40 TRINITY_DN3060_c0_g1_i8:137-1648(+)